MSLKGTVYKVNRIGPRTEPCRIPGVIEMGIQPASFQEEITYNYSLGSVS